MPACPWCQAPVTEVRFPCPSCGRRPKDHVSFSHMSAVAPPAATHPARPPQGGLPELEELQELEEVVDEVPELDLKVPSLAPPAMKARPVVAAPAPAAAPAARKAPAPAHAFDDGMDVADLGSIDLGTGMLGAAPVPESTRAPGPASEASPEWARISAVNAPTAPTAVRVTAVSTVLMSEDGGRGAATRLGDYGLAPSEWWKTPMYAYRVKTRQMDLRKALAARRVDLENAQSAADDALVVLAERVRSTAMQKTAYAKLLDAVIVAENTLKERDSELAAATEAHKRQTSGLDAQIARHEAEMAVARAEEKSHVDVFERVDAVRQRADAKVKRVDIDLRAAMARAGNAGRKPDASDPEVAARTAERDARLAELEQSMPAVTDAAQKLTVARKKVTAIEQKMRTVKNERAALEDQFKKRGAAHGAQVAKAQKDVRIATVALGRAVSLDVATFGAEWTEARSEIAALDKASSARDDDVMLHVMALDVHDAPTVQRGLGIAFGVIALLVALMVTPFVLSALGGKPPAPPPPAAVE